LRGTIDQEDNGYIRSKKTMQIQDQHMQWQWTQDQYTAKRVLIVQNTEKHVFKVAIPFFS
jgi:hypothetical protein